MMEARTKCEHEIGKQSAMDVFPNMRMKRRIGGLSFVGCASRFTFGAHFRAFC